MCMICYHYPPVILNFSLFVTCMKLHIKKFLNLIFWCIVSCIMSVLYTYMRVYSIHVFVKYMYVF